MPQVVELSSALRGSGDPRHPARSPRTRRGDREGRDPSSDGCFRAVPHASSRADRPSRSQLSISGRACSHSDRDPTRRPQPRTPPGRQPPRLRSQPETSPREAARKHETQHRSCDYHATTVIGPSRLRLEFLTRRGRARTCRVMVPRWLRADGGVRPRRGRDLKGRGPSTCRPRGLAQG